MLHDILESSLFKVLGTFIQTIPERTVSRTKSRLMPPILFVQADREREITIEHLADIDRLVNESLQMLSSYPDLNTKILPLMEDYLIALRSRDNTPAPLLSMDREHEEQMINNYRAEMEAKIKGDLEFSHISWFF